MVRRTGKKSKKQQIAEHINGILVSSDTLADYVEQLQQAGIQSYVRGKADSKIMGYVVDGRKHRLTTLGLAEEFDEMLHRFETGMQHDGDNQTEIGSTNTMSNSIKRNPFSRDQFYTKQQAKTKQSQTTAQQDTSEKTALVNQPNKQQRSAIDQGKSKSNPFTRENHYSQQNQQTQVSKRTAKVVDDVNKKVAVHTQKNTHNEHNEMEAEQQTNQGQVHQQHKQQSNHSNQPQAAYDEMVAKRQAQLRQRAKDNQLKKDNVLKHSNSRHS